MGPQATSHALPAIKHISALFLHQFVRDSKMSITQRSGERKLLKPGHFSSSTQEWEMTPYALWQTFPLASVKTSTTAELSYINSLTSVSWSHIFFLTSCYNPPEGLLVECQCLLGRGSLAAAPCEMRNFMNLRSMAWQCCLHSTQTPGHQTPIFGDEKEMRENKSISKLLGQWRSSEVKAEMHSTATAGGHGQEGSGGSRCSHRYCQLVNVVLTVCIFFC